MRLFIAVNFDENIRNKLNDSVKKLQMVCADGKFTRLENFHLTLAFIGETTKVGKIVEILDSVDFSAFCTSMGRIGQFKRTGGNICFVEIEKSKELLMLQKYIRRALLREGISLDRREFKPHLTLGREIVGLDESAFSSDLVGTAVNVDKVSLMKSERDSLGRLIYTEIYSKELKSFQ